MFTFIFLAMGAIIVIAAILIAYGANQRKRAGQSGQAVVNTQTAQAGTPRIGRPSGMN